ncbi:hypothetical protein MUK42_03313, partial [Musa troglodytarum]
VTAPKRHQPIRHHVTVDLRRVAPQRRRLVVLPPPNRPQCLLRHLPSDVTAVPFHHPHQHLISPGCPRQPRKPHSVPAHPVQRRHAVLLHCRSCRAPHQRCHR